tara:strand:- start:92 stop:319 length:228 start_codon:yes stop_codon:yes gene_type:complete
MIKDFECYSKRQSLINSCTQWRKRYDDGQTAWVVVDDRRITRARVREAFEAQEHGVTIACFQESDSGHAWAENIT